MAEALNLVKDGDLEGLKSLFTKADVKKDPEEEVGEASMLRCDIFGKSYWSGGMSALLWAIEGSNVQICPSTCTLTYRSAHVPTLTGVLS